MSWTPPSKFTVFISFLIMAFGIFILLDLSGLIWASLLPVITIFGDNTQSWLVIAMIVFFFSWILFYLGVQLKGM